MLAADLSGGFTDEPRQAAHAFRAIMEAMARPGTIRTLDGAAPPSPLSPAAGAVLLTLLDGDTPLHLAGEADCGAVRTWLAFHTGAPLAGRADCMFAVGTWEALGPLKDYPAGTPDYPDRSATLIVEHPGLAPAGTPMRGPGIRGVAELALPGPEALGANAARYPLGLDFLFTCKTRLAALPRSTRLGAPLAGEV